MSKQLTCDYCGGSVHDIDDLPCRVCGGTGTLCDECHYPADNCDCEDDDTT